MLLNANMLYTNLLVTVLVAVLVFFLPWLDRRICRRLGVNLHHGVSKNPHADALLSLRQTLLFLVFAVYLALFAYLVFFSRAASESYRIHIAPFYDLQKAIDSDHGVFDILMILFTEGPQEALSHIRVVKAEDIAQVYMNMMLFVPMGYLLPDVFEDFRSRASVRPVLACFVISFVTENLQLIFKRGFYDMDDLLANTLGGLIGQLLFIAVAYVVTHPGWRAELADYRRYRRTARRATLYPYAHRMGLSRTTLWGTDEEEISFFYGEKLGFYLRCRLNVPDSFGTDLLFEMGRSQVEILCSNLPEELPEQQLTISANDLSRLRRRLKKHGVDTGPFGSDPYTGRRTLSFTGPDQVLITVIED